MKINSSSGTSGPSSNVKMTVGIPVTIISIGVPRHNGWGVSQDFKWSVISVPTTGHGIGNLVLHW